MVLPARRDYYHACMHTALMRDKVSELPFLDLGDDARVSGEGKFFGILDHAIMLNETELPRFLPFPFGNDTETRIYVSYHIILHGMHA